MDSFYDELSQYYQSKNLNWNKLAKHQQFVLIRAYRRKRFLSNKSFNNETIINAIKKDFRFSFDYSERAVAPNRVELRWLFSKRKILC